MFILLNEPSVVKNVQPAIVARSNYNPLYDDNISGLTTNNGNWIKKKIFIFDFLNQKESLKPKTLVKSETSYSTSVYSMPGDIPLETQEITKYIDYEDTLIDVSHSFWSRSGGTDSAIFKMNVKIPWLDIESWLKSNYLNEKEGKIKSLYLIPEIKLINSPLNSATIKFKDLKINDNLSFNSYITNSLSIPEKMQESEWTASDILGVIYKVSGFSATIAGFLPGAGLATTATGAALSIGAEINDALSKKHKDYIYTNKEENRIKIASDLKLEYGKDLNISIPEIEVTGTRIDGKYWADFTHATLSNLYVVMELE